LRTKARLDIGPNLREGAASMAFDSGGDCWAILASLINTAKLWRQPAS
jgi:hypothetical protein